MYNLAVCGFCMCAIVLILVLHLPLELALNYRLAHPPVGIRAKRIRGLDYRLDVYCGED